MRRMAWINKEKQKGKEKAENKKKDYRSNVLRASCVSSL